MAPEYFIFSNHQYNYTDSRSGCAHGVNSDNMLRLNDFKECLLRELDRQALALISRRLAKVCYTNAASLQHKRPYMGNKFSTRSLCLNFAVYTVVCRSCNYVPAPADEHLVILCCCVLYTLLKQL